MSRQTIGENPLDTIIPNGEEVERKLQPIKAKEKAKKAIDGKVAKKPSNLNKQRLTVQISEDIIERAKNAVYWTRGLTLAQLTEEALEKAISTLENSSVIYNDRTGQPLKKEGEPFPKRTEELKTGRPVK